MADVVRTANFCKGRSCAKIACQFLCQYLQTVLQFACFANFCEVYTASCAKIALPIFANFVAVRAKIRDLCNK
jgi:hypothetical protein